MCSNCLLHAPRYSTLCSTAAHFREPVPIRLIGAPPKRMPQLFPQIGTLSPSVRLPEREYALPTRRGTPAPCARVPLQMCVHTCARVAGRLPSAAPLGRAAAPVATAGGAQPRVGDGCRACLSHCAFPVVYTPIALV